MFPLTFFLRLIDVKISVYINYGLNNIISKTLKKIFPCEKNVSFAVVKLGLTHQIACTPVGNAQRAARRPEVSCPFSPKHRFRRFLQIRSDFQNTPWNRFPRRPNFGQNVPRPHRLRSENSCYCFKPEETF